MCTGIGNTVIWHNATIKFCCFYNPGPSVNGVTLTKLSVLRQQVFDINASVNLPKTLMSNPRLPAFYLILAVNIIILQPLLHHALSILKHFVFHQKSLFNFKDLTWHRSFAQSLGSRTRLITCLLCLSRTPYLAWDFSSQNLDNIRACFFLFLLQILLSKRLVAPTTRQ